MQGQANLKNGKKIYKKRTITKLPNNNDSHTGEKKKSFNNNDSYKKRPNYNNSHTGTNIQSSKYNNLHQKTNMEPLYNNSLTCTTKQPSKYNDSHIGKNLKIYKYNDSHTGKNMEPFKCNDSHNMESNKNINNIPITSIDLENDSDKYQKNTSSFRINQNNICPIEEDNSGLKQRKKIENKNINPSNNYMIKNAQNFQPLYNNKNFSKKSDSVCNWKSFNNRLGTFRKESRYTNGTIGLVNIGNTCYLNSALQNLKNIYPLTLRLLEKHTNFNQQGFTYRYCELIANLINQKHCQYYTPKNEFFYNLNKLAPIFKFGEQNDSNFCILYILHFLEKETKNTRDSNQMKVNKHLSKEEVEKLNKFLEKFYNKRNSFIIDLFYGFQENIYKCMRCTYTSYTFQGFNVLNLSIMNQNNTKILTLENAIEHY